MGKTVLISGGTGMIGARVAHQLKHRGHNVRILTRSALKSKDFDYYSWDPDKDSIQEGAVEGIDAIIHLAGENIGERRWTKTRKKALTDSRVKTAKLLKDTIAKQEKKPEVFVSASGIGYYGYDTGSILIKEGSRFGDDFLATLVKKWEAAADEFQLLGMRVVKFRTSIVLSPSKGALAVMAKPVKMWLGAALGRGDQYISWIHLNDIVSLYIFAIENDGIKDVFNAVSSEPVTNKVFMKSIAKVLNKPFFLPNVPSFVLKLYLGEMSSIVTGGNRVTSEKIRLEGFEFEHDTLEAALENLWISKD